MAEQSEKESLNFSFGGALVTKLCSILVTPMDCSSPGSAIRAISQGRMLEWVTISFSRGSS